jgi:hypothetical protein
MPLPTSFYYDGLTFAAATNVWLDAALTNPAPDGFYGTAGYYRQKVGGVLLQQTICDTCTVSCGNMIPGIVFGQGKYNFTYDIGTTTGAVLVRFDPGAVPSKCTWTYGGVSASEYSSSTEGYLQGLVGTIAAGADLKICGNTIDNATGSNAATYSVTEYNWQTSTSTFESEPVSATLGPYTNNAAGGTSLTAADPGFCVMVIPKPNATPSTATFVIESPCSGNPGITVNCPIQLNEFLAGPAGGACGVYPNKMYTAHVGNATGVSTSISVNDWAFLDINGVTQHPAGTFPVFAGGSKCVTVSADGIVTAVTACVGTC